MLFGRNPGFGFAWLVTYTTALVFAGYLQLLLLFQAETGFKQAVISPILINSAILFLRLPDAISLTLGHQFIRHILLFCGNYLAYLGVGVAMYGITTLQLFYGHHSAVRNLFWLQVLLAVLVFVETVYYETLVPTLAPTQGSLRRTGVVFLILSLIALLVVDMLFHVFGVVITNSLREAPPTTFELQSVAHAATYLFYIHLGSIFVELTFVVFLFLRFCTSKLDNRSSSFFVFAVKAFVMASSSFALTSTFGGVGVITAFKSEVDATVKFDGLETVGVLDFFETASWVFGLCFVVLVFSIDNARRRTPVEDPLEK